MIREAEPIDAEVIEAIRVAAWKAAYRQFMPEDFLNALRPAGNLSALENRLSQQDPDFTAFVAEEREAVVGFSIVGKPRYIAAARTMEIWAVNVLPDYWRIGIGSRLVTRAIQFACSADFDRIELWCIKGNTPAQLAYSKLGFVESGSERITSNLTGNALHEVHYVKSL